MKLSLLTSKCLIAAFMLLTLSMGGIAYAQPSPPKNVKDYFLLLPQIYFEMPHERRESWLSQGGTVDIKNGYLRFPGDGAQSTIVVALFHAKDSVTVGVYLTAEEGELNFLRYVNGHWKNVTRQVMPTAFNEDYQYELPHYGTTIHVTRNKFNPQSLERAAKVGKKVYDLVWTQGKFVIRR